MIERPSFDLVIAADKCLCAVRKPCYASVQRFGPLILETENLKARHENGL